MGADLIGYMVRGPEYLLDTDVARAKVVALERLQHVRKLEAAREALEDYRLRLPDDLPIDSMLSEDDLLQNVKACEEVLVECGMGYVDPIISADVAGLLDSAVETTVEELRQAWHNGGFRDTVTRVFHEPDGRKRRVMFAGQTSWGDTPDGMGYYCLDLLHTLNILDVLGIE